MFLNYMIFHIFLRSAKKGKDNVYWGGKFMSKILLDSVTYSSENGLILNATAYNSCNGEIEKNLGIWHRDDIINALNEGNKISRAKIGTNVEDNYIGQEICSISVVTIDGNIYLKNSDYSSDLEKDDVIERNRGLKRK